MLLIQKNLQLLMFCVIGGLFIQNTSFSATFTNGELTEYHDFTKLMFSSKITNNSNTNNQLLVVKNNTAFIRESHKNSFEYIKVKDMCYTLENMCAVCIKNGKIYNVVCNANKQNTELLTGLMIGDPFFNESNDNCNKMKFDVINNYFVNNHTITYAIYQLFLVGYYDVARLVLFKNNNTIIANSYVNDEYNIDGTLAENKQIKNLITENLVQAFVISSKNDISCSPYDKFLIYNHKSLAVLQEEARKHKNKTNNKTKNKDKNTEDYKYIYGRIALKGYQHLQKYEKITDLNNVVIVLQNDKVKEINIVALDFKWDTNKGQQLLAPYSFEYEMPNKNNTNNKSNTAKK